MFKFKRFTTIGLISLMFAGLMPVSVVESSNGGALVTASASPTTFNPTATTNNKVAITFTMNQAISPGQRVTVQIFNATDQIVNYPWGTTYAMPAGLTNTTYWDGKNEYANDTLVPAGDYTYRIAIDDVEATRGTVTVTYGIIIPPPPAGTVNISNSYVLPNPFNNDLESPYFYFNLDRLATVTLTVRNNNGTLVKTIANQSFQAGQGFIFWNGADEGGNYVPAGIYTYRLDASVMGATDYETGNFTVTRNQPVAFDVTNVYANPSTFNADTQNTGLTFSLNQDANITVWVMRPGDGAIIKTLYPNQQPVLAGTNRSITWTGTDATDNLVPAGTYTFKVYGTSTVSGAGSDSEINTVTVTRTPVQNNPVITDFGPTPGTFDPQRGESTTLRYQLNQNGTASVAIFSGTTTLPSMTVRQFGALNMTAGVTNQTVWDGKNANGQILPEGTYTYQIAAANQSGLAAQAKTGTIVVDYVNVSPILDLYNAYANPASFNADTQTTQLTWSMNQPASVTVKVRRSSDNTTVKTLAFNQSMSAGTNLSLSWNGTDDNGAFVPAGSYYFTVDGTSTTYGNDSVTSSAFTVTRSTQNVLDVYNAFANPNPFNPETQNTLLTFSLNQNANITVTVTRASDGGFIRTIMTNQAFNAGTNWTVTWSGTDQTGTLVPAGLYNFRVDATSSVYGNDSLTGSVNVNRTGGQGTLDVYNVFANPNSFNPENQNTLLTFSLNQNASATVTVTRASDGAFIKSVVSNQFFNAGTGLTATWSGTDSNGVLVPAGLYNFRVDATSSTFGSDSMTGTVTVTRGTQPGVLDVYNAYASPNPFNPENRNTALYFSLNQNAYVTITVRTQGSGTFVKTVTSNTFYSAGSNMSAVWDGSNSSGNLVSDGVYELRIDASNAQYGSDSTTAVVTVDRKGIPPITDCGNFTDVSEDHYLCPAVEFAKSRGIFRGYPDGRLGVDQVIQRAEFLAVIQKAFQYPLDSYSASRDGDLGFTDLANQTNEWYMPYVKTFLRLKLMVGYPDGRMRPERTMNTAELYLVFLKAALKSPKNVANFTLEDHIVYKPPFSDTPVSSKTQWYLKYAEFAQLNDLVTEDRFYPERGITRGQVLQLIYDTHRKGLVTYGPPLN